MHDGNQNIEGYRPKNLVGVAMRIFQWLVRLFYILVCCSAVGFGFAMAQQIFEAITRWQY